MKRQSRGVLLTTPEAAALIGCSVSLVEAMRRKGDGPRFIRVRPKFVGYRREDIEQWIEERAATKATPKRKKIPARPRQKPVLTRPIPTPEGK